MLQRPAAGAPQGVDDARASDLPDHANRKYHLRAHALAGSTAHSGRASSSETTCRSSLLLRVSTGTRLLKTSIVCSSAPRLHLAVGIAFPERQSSGEHICCRGGRAARVPTLAEKSPLVKAWVQQLHARAPATGAAHTEARRRRRSRCRRCTSARPAVNPKFAADGMAAPARTQMPAAYGAAACCTLTNILSQPRRSTRQLQMSHDKLDRLMGQTGSAAGFLARAAAGCRLNRQRRTARCRKRAASHL